MLLSGTDLTHQGLLLAISYYNGSLCEQQLAMWLGEAASVPLPVGVIVGLQNKRRTLRWT